jgi:hypothetical protein
MTFIPSHFYAIARPPFRIQALPFYVTFRSFTAGAVEGVSEVLTFHFLGALAPS